MTRQIEQVAHGFTALQIVRHNGTDWELAQSDAASSNWGLVASVPSVDRFILAQRGQIEIAAHGLTVGSVYYIDPTTPGSTTTTIPVPPNRTDPVFVVEDVDTLFVFSPEGGMWMSVELADSSLNLAKWVLLQKGVSETDIANGLYQQVYSDSGDLPPAPPVNPSYAVVLTNDGIGLFDIAWWQGAGWDVTSFPWNSPPSPLGDWIINADDDSIGSGTNSSAWAMGIEFRIKAAGAGLSIKRIALKCGSGIAGQTRTWEIRKSTLVQASAPALSTYTIMVDTGTQLLTGNAWDEITLGTAITVAENEWYVVWYDSGGGWQSVSMGSLGPGDLDETYADLYGGAYIAQGSFPAPPATRSTFSVYGFTSAGIG